MQTKSLFNPLKAKTPHRSFLGLRDSPDHAMARELIDAMFGEAGDVDGNFIKDFQGPGFQSRLFELACFAYLRECGLTLDRNYSRPDFMGSCGEARVAVEAVSLNPTGGRERSISLEDLEPISDDESVDKSTGELPIRLKASFSRKLASKYWAEDHCSDVPIVLAVAPFNEPGSVFHVDESAARYLFGTEIHDDWTERNGILVRQSPIRQHAYRGRAIQSDFFTNEPDAENISAVLWCNQFTVAKFFRMATKNAPAFLAKRQIQLEGYQRSSSGPIRRYAIGKEHLVSEAWATGVTLFINPRARVPLAPHLLAATCRYEMKQGTLQRSAADFHPLTTSMLVCPSRP